MSLNFKYYNCIGYYAISIANLFKYCLNIELTIILFYYYAYCMLCFVDVIRILSSDQYVLYLTVVA